MKKTKKIIKILFIVFLFTLIFQRNIFATTIDTDIEIGKTQAIHSSDNMITELVGIFQVVGTVISVLALVIIGIRYMLSSLEERAQMKGILGYYIVGAVLVFATSNILGIVYNVITQIN